METRACTSARKKRGRRGGKDNAYKRLQKAAAAATVDAVRRADAQAALTRLSTKLGLTEYRWLWSQGQYSIDMCPDKLCVLFQVVCLGTEK